MTAAILGFVMGFFGSVPITGPVAMMVLLWAAKGRTRAAMALVLCAALGESGYAGRAFYGSATRGGVHWVDSRCQELGDKAKVREVAFGSEAYFELITDRRVTAILALGQHVRFVLDGKIVVVK